MHTLAIVLILAVASLLVLRFAEPEALYYFRENFLVAKLNRAFLFVESESRVEDGPSLILDSIRPEGTPRKESDIYLRLRKIGALSSALEGRDPSAMTASNWLAYHARMNICLVELSNILRDLALRAKPRFDGKQSSLKAITILEQIVARRIDKREDIAIGDDYYSYFAANPISIEECIEVLTACIYPLSIRVSKEDPW